jgi:tetratricopeptide (TPR) repeat protein
MHSLPWLFVHGPIVWQAGIAALVLVALAVAFVRPRRAVRRAAEAARARIGVPAAMPAKPNDGMRVTLTGTLEIEGAPCQRFEDGEGAAAATAAYLPRGARDAWVSGLNVRAERLLLRAGEAQIALEGQVEVAAGAREVRRGEALADMPLAVKDRIAAGFKLGAPHFREQPTLLRSVGAGDVVRVTGVLRRESPAGESAGYRAAAERWALVPDGDAAQAAAGAAAPAGLVIAFEGTPRLRGPGVLWYAKHAAAGAVAALALFALGGEIAFASAESAIADLAAGKAPNADAATSAVGLVAATPFRRTQALAELQDVLDLQHGEDAAIVERRAMLHETEGDCAGAAKVLIQHGLIARGADMAARCGEHRIAAEAYYEIGDFAHASEAWERLGMLRVDPSHPGGDLTWPDVDLRFGLRVHLLAGRPAVAAQLAFAQSTTRARTARALEASREAMLGCLGRALDAKGGNKGAIAQLRADRLDYPACAVLLADLYAGKERVELIHSLTNFQASAREVPMRWLELLEEEVDATVAPTGPVPRVIEDPSLVVINPAVAVQEMLPGVERALAESLTREGLKLDDTRRATRVRATVLAASFAAATGDYHAARRFAKAAAAEAEQPAPAEDYSMSYERWDAPRAAALSAAVELAAGDVARARELAIEAGKPMQNMLSIELDALLRYRGERDPDRLPYNYRAWQLTEGGFDQPFADAAKGDGAALAAWLRRPSSTVGPFLRLGAPLVLGGREQLLTWIRVGYRVPGWYRSPSDQLVHWMELASAASALGDQALATELWERAGRFRAALLRREIAVPLAVIERL